MTKNHYSVILIFLFLVLIFGSALIIIGKLLGRNNPDNEKNSQYECGFEAFGDARMQFDIRYYLITILFILFDLEVVFLIPWALIFRDLGLYAFSIMFIFLLILIIGFVYVWKKGALEWD